MNSDIKNKIKKLGSFLILVDKIINYYIMILVLYDKFIKENVMKIYKKLSDIVVNKLDM